MSEQNPPTVWPALQAHDPDLLIRTLVDLGFEDTVVHRDDAGVVQHAELGWPEGGGVMLGAHKPDGPFTQQPGTSAAYVVTRDVDAVWQRAKDAGLEPGDVVEQDYGSREVRVTDPEGNQWSFGTYAGEPRRG
jgi:uncharacterized glyoxalase superfamily protein PhnB